MPPRSGICGTDGSSPSATAVVLEQLGAGERLGQPIDARAIVGRRVDELVGIDELVRIVDLRRAGRARGRLRGGGGKRGRGGGGGRRGGGGAGTAGRRRPPPVGPTSA